MAVPTIATIAPVTGPAGGGELVSITGTNFRLYTPPSSGVVQGRDNCYVSVLFGSIASGLVLVFTAGRLDALAPAYDGDVDLDVYPATSVTVQNLNDNLEPIPGESVTRTAAFTYTREDLRKPTLGAESPITRITRRLLYLMKREVLVNASPRTHTDFSSDGVEVAQAGVPSIYALGPEIFPDAYGWENESITEVQPDGTALVWPNPIMHTLRYTLLGNSDSQTEFITLMSAVRKVVWRNPYMVISGDVPSGSEVRLPMVMTDEPSPGTGIFNANLHNFSTKLEIRRVPILYLPPYYRVWGTVEQAGLQVQRPMGTLVETIPLW